MHSTGQMGIIFTEQYLQILIAYKKEVYYEGITP